jgi:hypothetical protein
MNLKASDLIALASAGVAFIALLIGIYAASVTQRVATSGFQSAERVKSDTAILLAALRSFMVKAALYSQQDPKLRNDKNFASYIDVQPERTIIQSFLNSPTAIAYYSFVTRKSKEATEAGRKGEEWRVFFLYIGQLTFDTNVYNAGKAAAKIERMLEKLSNDDLEEMSSSLEDLIGSIKTTIRDRKYDPLLEAFVGAKSDTDDSEAIQRFISYLRNQRLKDPDVDLLWAAGSGDAVVLKDALKRGAKVDVTTGEIISRYKEKWETFRANDTSSSQ